MKYSIFSLLLALIVFSCGGPEGEKVTSDEAAEPTVTTIAAGAYMVNPTESTIHWEGTKLVGGGHEGTIAVQDGKIAVAEGKIVGGEFVIDMNSINTTDLEAGDGKEDLEDHLKSSDFFDTENHPTAKFTIINTQAIPDAAAGEATHKVMGNLALRDSVRSVAIPVIISVDGDILKATTKDFVIDRTEWGVTYNADGSVADLAKDRIINDNIGLQLTIVAKK